MISRYQTSSVGPARGKLDGRPRWLSAPLVTTQRTLQKTDTTARVSVVANKPSIDKVDHE
jgi:hypothetical protein